MRWITGESNDTFSGNKFNYNCGPRFTETCTAPGLKGRGSTCGGKYKECQCKPEFKYEIDADCQDASKVVDKSSSSCTLNGKTLYSACKCAPKFALTCSGNQTPGEVCGTLASECLCPAGWTVCDLPLEGKGRVCEKQVGNADGSITKSAKVYETCSCPNEYVKCDNGPESPSTPSCTDSAGTKYKSCKNVVASACGVLPTYLETIYRGFGNSNPADKIVGVACTCNELKALVNSGMLGNILVWNSIDCGGDTITPRNGQKIVGRAFFAANGHSWATDAETNKASKISWNIENSSEKAMIVENDTTVADLTLNLNTSAGKPLENTPNQYRQLLENTPNVISVESGQKLYLSNIDVNFIDNVTNAANIVIKGEGGNATVILEGKNNLRFRTEGVENKNQIAAFDNVVVKSSGSSILNVDDGKSAVSAFFRSSVHLSDNAIIRAKKAPNIKVEFLFYNGGLHLQNHAKVYNYGRFIYLTEINMYNDSVIYCKEVQIGGQQIIDETGKITLNDNATINTMSSNRIPFAHYFFNLNDNSRINIKMGPQENDRSNLSAFTHTKEAILNDNSMIVARFDGIPDNLQIVTLFYSGFFYNTQFLDRSNKGVFMNGNSKIFADFYNGKNGSLMAHGSYLDMNSANTKIYINSESPDPALLADLSTEIGKFSSKKGAKIMYNSSTDASLNGVFSAPTMPITTISSSSIFEPTSLHVKDLMGFGFTKIPTTNATFTTMKSELEEKMDELEVIFNNFDAHFNF